MKKTQNEQNRVFLIKTILMIYEEKYFPKNSIDQKIKFDPQKICQILEIWHFYGF